MPAATCAGAAEPEKTQGLVALRPILRGRCGECREGSASEVRGSRGHAEAL